MDNVVLELKGITKRFPGVTALNNVSFELRRGEIHALMGENGAGKSTLIKVITGVHIPDEGQIIVNGKEVFFRDTGDSARHRIAAVYQHSTAYPQLSVTENIFIGHMKCTRLGLIDWNYMHSQAEKLLNSLGSSIDPRSRMSSLSVAEQQIVEISKAVSANAEILIMDEPTAALSKRECEELYRITEQLRDQGKSILFISHRLEDMYRLADRVTVYRDASYIGTWPIREVTNEILVHAMVGREIKDLYPKLMPDIGEVILEVEKLTRMGYFRDISFQVRRGEIFGLTGLVGAGRSEVCQAICGVTGYDSGTVRLKGKTVHFRHPSQAIRRRVGYLPEDRQKQGLFLSWELFRNQTISSLSKYRSLLGIDQKAEKRDGEKMRTELSIKSRDIYSHADALSGGNQQKVVLAKLLNSEMDVLILDEPTKGVDVGAKSQMYEIMSDLARKGYAIILISSEMPEILAMSDRIGIMHEGSLVKILEREEATQEKLLAYAMNSADVILEEESNGEK